MTVRWKNARSRRRTSTSFTLLGPTQYARFLASYVTRLKFIQQALEMPASIPAIRQLKQLLTKEGQVDMEEEEALAKYEEEVPSWCPRGLSYCWCGAPEGGNMEEEEELGDTCLFFENCQCGSASVYFG